MQQAVQGGNINALNAPPASTVNKITWSCYITLDSLISLPVLVGGVSEALMLPPCTVLCGIWGTVNAWRRNF